MNGLVCFERKREKLSEVGESKIKTGLRYFCTYWVIFKIKIIFKFKF